MANIETVRNRRLSPHSTVVSVLLQSLLSSRHCHASNTVFEGYNRIDRSGKSQLKRPSHLPRILTSRHHSSKAANVEESATHYFSSRFDPFALFFFCCHFLVLVRVCDQ